MTGVRIVQVAMALGILVFVHELGHFLAAKWAGVRVEVFCFGFGPFLFSFRRGDTVYAVSLIPLGGYLRMTGQADVGRVKESEMQVPHSYLAKPPSKRAVIIVAGVFMNVVLAYVLFAGAYQTGIIDVPAVAGEVVPGSPADEAGIAKGDRILEVCGSPSRRFQEVSVEIAIAGAGKPVELKLGRPDGSTVEVQVTPKLGERRIASIGIEPPTEPVRIGVAVLPGLGVVDVVKGGPAEAAGMKRWDYVATVDGRPFGTLQEFKAALRRAEGREVVLGVRRRGEADVVPVRVTPEPRGETVAGTDYRVGLALARHVVAEVDPNSAAYEAGLRRGDFVKGIFVPFDRDSAEVYWITPGDEADAAAVKAKSATLPKSDTGLALRDEIDSTTPTRELIAAEGIGASFAYAARESVGSVRKTFKILVGLFRGSVPAKEMAGPLGILGATYHSTKSGLGYYLWLVAFISVNLAVINLFPMVPLDGGLLAFLGYEALRGRPASQRVQEVAQIVGLVLILALVIFVTGNDILRFSGRS